MAEATYYEDFIDSIDRFHAADLTPMLWSGPGEGKSALIAQLVERKTTIFGEAIAGHISLSAVGADETDYQGVLIPTTFVDQATGQTVTTTANATPDWAIRASNADGIFYVFIDELTANRSVHAPLLTILSGFVMPNGYKLNRDNVRFIFAGNPTHTTDDAEELIPPLSNRIAHMDFAPEFADWSHGLINNWGKPMGESERMFRALVAQYLKTDTTLLTRGAVYGTKTEIDRKRGWPTKRSWEGVAKALTAFEGAPHRRAMAIDALVGEGNSAALLSFIDEVRLPSPEEVLDHPKIMDELGLDVSRRFIVVNAAMHYALERREPLRFAEMFDQLGNRDHELVAPELAAHITTMMSILPDGIEAANRISNKAGLNSITVFKDSDSPLD